MTARAKDEPNGSSMSHQDHGLFTVVTFRRPSLSRMDQAHRPVPRSARGFTLLELLVVMVIIGLLAGFVGPRLFGQIGKSETKVARAQIDALGKALDHYRLDVGQYPGTSQGLGALMQAPGDAPRWQGPYLAKLLPPDPWGRPYQYRSPGEHGEYDLYTLGRDGAPGGEGDSADLGSW